jgi:hypothetical protein
MTRISSRCGSWLLLAIVLILPGDARALGEVFKVDTSGTEYCGDLDSTKFSAKNDVDLWARIDSKEQITLSFTLDFVPGTTIPLTGFTYQSGNGRSAFAGGAELEGDVFVTIQGTATWDTKTGTVKKLSGIFIESQFLVNSGCFASGKFTATQRVQ